MRLFLIIVSLGLIGGGLALMANAGTAQGDPSTGLCIMGFGGFIGWLVYYFMRH